MYQVIFQKDKPLRRRFHAFLHARVVFDCVAMVKDVFLVRYGMEGEGDIPRGSAYQAGLDEGYYYNCVV